MTRRGLFASIGTAIAATTFAKFKDKNHSTPIGYNRVMIDRSKPEWCLFTYHNGAWHQTTTT